MINSVGDSELLDKLFPFRFVLDRNLKILSKGPGLKKLMPDGTDFESCFRFVRPGLGIRYERDSILEYLNQIFLLKITLSETSVLLKGQFIDFESEQRLMFCGSPWITNEIDFEKTGLKLKDFALHDSLVDMLQHVKEIGRAHV